MLFFNRENILARGIKIAQGAVTYFLDAAGEFPRDILPKKKKRITLIKIDNTSNDSNFVQLHAVIRINCKNHGG